MKILDWVNALNECREKGLKVFSIPELMNLSGHGASTLRRTLVRLKEKGVLRPLYTGLWGYGKDITLEDLFLKMDPDSYVSLETVLGRFNIIKSMSPDLVCVSLTQSRVLRTRVGVILFHKIKRDLFFGFDSMHFARPEKAFLDYVYFKTKAGYKISWEKFDLSEIDLRKFKSFLTHYPDFVKKIVRAHVSEITY